MLRTGVYLQSRYEILGLIGSGGMSDVYKAKCHKLNRLVAIKVLKEEFSNDAGFVGKFQMEAQAAARLSHPNIVNVYDVVDEGNLHYIVMELVEGITLKSYIVKKGVLEAKEAVGIAIQVAQGIAAAHEQEIIHRDIKPQNMLISREGKVKVADFGIARAVSTQTMTSEAMGSVHYISPEQARGGYTDTRSDIYSLGITLYEMMTGRLPFEGDNTVAIAIAHLQEPITMPSVYNPDIPVSLESIILKCTEKKPERRYPAMTDVIADLRRVLVYPDADFVQPVPDVDLKAGTVVIKKEELKEIKRGADSIRARDNSVEWDSGSSRENSRDWDSSTSRDRNNSRGWEEQRADDLDNESVRTRSRSSNWEDERDREGGDFRDWNDETNRNSSEHWENNDDRRTGSDDWEHEDGRRNASDDWGNESGRRNSRNREGSREQKTARTRDSKSRKEDHREWEWDTEEIEEEGEDVNHKFEKLFTALGVVIAIIIVAVLIVVFSRLGGLLSLNSDAPSSTVIETEPSSSTEETLNTMEVSVPDVLELPVDMAEAKLKENTLVMKVTAYEDSDTIDKGCIISQALPEGTVVQKYSSVSVIVSNGSDLIHLEELSLEGMSGDSAKFLLEQKKLKVNIQKEFHDTVSEGSVIRFDPQQARPGETVNLYVSSGPAPIMREVPDIRGVLEEDAVDALLESGLNPGQVTEEFSDTVPKGYIIGQEIEPNTLIEDGSAVPYKVSKGVKTKRYVAAINETYQVGGMIGPGVPDPDVRVEIRLKQVANGEPIYKTLMEATLFHSNTLIPVNFTSIEGTPGIDDGEVELVNADTGEVLASYPVKFIETE